MKGIAAGIAALLAGCGQVESGSGYVSQPTAQESSGTPWTMHSITLYLPEPVIAERVSTEALARYIQALRSSAATEFGDGEGRRGVSGAVVVMVQPEGQSRVWIVTGEPLPAETRQNVERALQEVLAPDVTGGPIVFGLLFSAWGGGVPPEGLPMPTPDGWAALSGQNGRVMDDSFYNEAWATE